MNRERKRSIPTYILGVLVVLATVIIGTMLTGRQASKDTEEAVRKVSLLYLDELAGRREQVVEHNLAGLEYAGNERIGSGFGDPEAV